MIFSNFRPIFYNLQFVLNLIFNQNLQDSALRELRCRDDDNIGRVFDGRNCTSSQKQLLPGFADVDDMDTYGKIN